jgi:hypothetical protein
VWLPQLDLTVLHRPLHNDEFRVVTKNKGMPQNYPVCAYEMIPVLTQQGVANKGCSPFARIPVMLLSFNGKSDLSVHS